MEVYIVTFNHESRKYGSSTILGTCKTFPSAWKMILDRCQDEKMNHDGCKFVPYPLNDKNEIEFIPGRYGWMSDDGIVDGLIIDTDFITRQFIDETGHKMYVIERHTLVD